jgi:DNA-binding CsgD family transcriptional regulator
MSHSFSSGLSDANWCENEYKAELSKALNRVDFFRIFHAIALKHEFDHFMILRLFSDSAKPALAEQLELHDLPPGLAEEYDSRFNFGEAILFNVLHETTLPTTWTDNDVDQDLLMQQLGFETALCLPVHGANGSRYAFIFVGDRDRPSLQETQALHYNACYCFDFYFRNVLANKKGMGLTTRELEILKWISHGKTASEIALIVSVSEHTVNSHTATILKKLDVVNRTQMVAKAIREQIIS